MVRLSIFRKLSCRLKTASDCESLHYQKRQGQFFHSINNEKTPLIFSQWSLRTWHFLQFRLYVYRSIDRQEKQFLWFSRVSTPMAWNRLFHQDLHRSTYGVYSLSTSIGLHWCYFVVRRSEQSSDWLRTWTGSNSDRDRKCHRRRYVCSMASSCHRC